MSLPRLLPLAPLRYLGGAARPRNSGVELPGDRLCWPKRKGLPVRASERQPISQQGVGRAGLIGLHHSVMRPRCLPRHPPSLSAKAASRAIPSAAPRLIPRVLKGKKPLYSTPDRALEGGQPLALGYCLAASEFWCPIRRPGAFIQALTPHHPFPPLTATAQFSSRDPF